ncbi:hypothetical protein NQ315_007717 [Exocentrus adspersus]|uniref:Carboxylic ester hydrolase n=1 Tax=Exocentrus adspersus TaxID=1586481 RepID=A0AAV8W9G1_9CUCU|nr:hypothetical protein NQ315_007717 [Exocentrus adspersus]
MKGTRYIFHVAILLTYLRMCSGQSDDEYPVVEIENGQVRGRSSYTVGENRRYFSFQGIPFAEPPLGQLRFRAPVKISNWTGILNATEDRSFCVQQSDPVIGSEDCLFINVYTPSLEGANRTVMVWIYGGSFVTGLSSYTENGPDYILDEGVIFVSLNYRLGALGFLSTEDAAAPGNWGLKDQLLALQWVQNNIGYFGGNASAVTVFGQSAGAASISYLLQSDKAAGLFSKVITQSGSSLCLWGLNRRARRTAFSIGTSLGISTNNSTVLLEKLREVDYTTLQTTATTVSTLITLENPLQGIFFGPVIEPESEEAIVVGRSDELFVEGSFQRVPILTGVNSNEAAAVGDVPDILRLYLTMYDVGVENLAPIDLNKRFSVRSTAAHIIMYRYFGFGLITIAPWDQVIKFISDDQWYRPVRRMVQSLSDYVPVYFYKFSYEGNLFGVTNRNFTGVGHSEELGYIFERNASVNYNVTETDRNVRAITVKLWTNFAKYGDPTPSPEPLLQNVNWEVAGTDLPNLNYLDINVELALKQNPFEESMEFYDGIYDTYGDSPYDTY